MLGGKKGILFLQENYGDQAPMNIMISYLEFANCIIKNNRVQNLSESEMAESVRICSENQCGNNTLSFSTFSGIPEQTPPKLIWDQNKQIQTMQMSPKCKKILRWLN